MLQAKSIRVRDFFRFTDAIGGYYSISRSYQFIGISGDIEQLSEDTIWERYDSIEKIDCETFEKAQTAYRDALWRQRGKPDSAELEALAETFLREYRVYNEDGRWHRFCLYDEETLRRLIECVVDAFFDQPPKAKARQKKWTEIYRDLVLAKVAISVGIAGSD